jgi:hypothetical protein
MRIFPISSIFSLNPCKKENKVKQNIWNKKNSAILFATGCLSIHTEIDNVQVEQGKKKHGKSLQK